MSYIHFLSKIFFLVKWIKGFLFWCGDLRNLVPFVKFQTVIHGVVTLLVSNTPLWVFSRPNNANHLILFPCKIKKSKKQSNYVQVSYITKGLWWHRYFLREASINKTKRHFTSFLARSYDTLNLKIALKILFKTKFQMISVWRICFRGNWNKLWYPKSHVDIVIHENRNSSTEGGSFSVPPNAHNK